MACRRALHQARSRQHIISLQQPIFSTNKLAIPNKGFHTCRRSPNKCEFGFLFDIDGVIVRGRKPLPLAKEAFQLLTKDQKFKVPTLFVTNAGNSLRCRKAKQLSEWLDIEVTEDQVVMSHSPLKMFRQFHDKHVLVNGQGPIKEIAHNIGFTHVTTTEELTQQFPNLDKMDHGRGKAAPCAFEKYFPPIEAVILFGEPVRWEMPIQLILDVLLTNGKPCKDLLEIPYPHLPVLACNMDLLWSSEASMPRLGHGCFMHTLEGLYQKITGKEMKYTALIGKPSEITYHHADHMLSQQAQSLGVEHIRTIYCIGDNPETDIYGGNVYNRYLQRRLKSYQAKKVGKKRSILHFDRDFLEDDGGSDDDFGDNDEDSLENRAIQTLEEDSSGMEKAYGCESILVCTGVFNKNSDFVTFGNQTSSHNHRDFVIDPSLTRPHHVVSNVYEAVKLVYAKEKYPCEIPLEHS